MDNDLIDDEGFDCFFTETDMLKQHCRLLETELAELHSELRESRGKIAALVLMWSGVSRELSKAEAELRQVKEALEVAVHGSRERASVALESQKDDQPSSVAFGLTQGPASVSR
jgi:predicted  nucleic acid-binding Zn-ribbon protein